MAVAPPKRSYTVPCPSAFRDAVEVLAAKRQVNAADIARSVLLVVPVAVLGGFPDPGEPERGDREAVVLKSGPAVGRPWRRKPRLQIRMADGYDVSTIRRALGLALALDRGELDLRVDPQGTGPAVERLERQVREKTEDLEHLRAMVSVLAFDPLPNGVRSRDDALHVLGFPPGTRPDPRTVKAKFRMLATVHHPDGRFGNHQRMSQLNAAMDILRHG